MNVPPLEEQSGVRRSLTLCATESRGLAIKKCRRRESGLCSPKALTPSPQPHQPLTWPRCSKGGVLPRGLPGAGWWVAFFRLCSEAFQTLTVYWLYLKSLIFELLSFSYATSSCLDCDCLQSSRTFNEGLDTQFSIVLTMKMMV